MATKSISELLTQASAELSDLFEVAVVDANSATGYASKKMSAEVIAEGMLNDYTYPTAMPNMQNKTIIGAINQLLANFAPIYDATSTYNENDLVTYEGVLYKANQDITVAEAWNSTHWTPTTASESIRAVHYSTDEQIIGTWIDGSTIYKKTFDFGENVTFLSNRWADTPILVSTNGINKIVSVDAMSYNGTNWCMLGVNTDNVYVQIWNYRAAGESAAITIRYLTLYYTKVSS